MRCVYGGTYEMNSKKCKVVKAWAVFQDGILLSASQNKKCAELWLRDETCLLVQVEIRILK